MARPAGLTFIDSEGVRRMVATVANRLHLYAVRAQKKAGN